jgi:hypothetical protein
MDQSTISNLLNKIYSTEKSINTLSSCKSDSVNGSRRLTLFPSSLTTCNAKYVGVGINYPLRPK